MQKAFLLLTIFLTIAIKGFTQNFNKVLQSKTWYVIGTFENKQTIKLFPDKKSLCDWYGNFLSNNKIIYNGIINESSIDQNGNELAVGQIVKIENYTYLIKADLIKITFHSKATKIQDEYTGYYYYKITVPKDKKGLVFTPISETSYK